MAGPKVTEEEWEAINRRYLANLERMTPRQREHFHEAERINESWSTNEWLRNAGSILVAGGGAVSVAFLVAGIPLNYDAAAFFYVGYFTVASAACVLYLMVKRGLRSTPNISTDWVTIGIVALSAVYYLFGGIATLTAHNGWFAPAGGWPIAAYTKLWWRFVAGSLLAGFYGLAFRFSADWTAHKCSERLELFAEERRELEAAPPPPLTIRRALLRALDRTFRR
jgi:hypothetical protein